MTTKCEKHSSKMLNRYCKPCNIPICEMCASSKRHRGHAIVDIVEELERQKYDLQGYLQELKKISILNLKRLQIKSQFRRSI